MSIPRDLVAVNPGLGEHSILVAWRGSVAHGMFLPSDDPHSVDDKDIIALCVPPLENYFGLKDFAKRGTQEIKRDEYDILVYEVRKAIGLLQQGNPNILALLWLPHTGFIKKTSAGDLLLSKRALFAGAWTYNSFVGYARGQMHKMTHQAGLGYLGEKRKRLVEEYGYDCKNAAHMIRLLRMACEFLKTGELIVDRGGLDATELIEIKRGEWTLPQVEQEAQRLFTRAEAAYDRCTLPTAPDRDAISLLCAEVVWGALHDRGETV